MMRAKLLLLMVGFVAPLTISAETSNLASIERGKMLYEKNMCVTCHGTAGNGGERTRPKDCAECMAVGSDENAAAQPATGNAALQRKISKRRRSGRYPRLAVNDQDRADGEGYSIAGEFIVYK